MKVLKSLNKRKGLLSSGNFDRTIPGELINIVPLVNGRGLRGSDSSNDCTICVVGEIDKTKEKYIEDYKNKYSPIYSEDTLVAYNSCCYDTVNYVDEFDVGDVLIFKADRLVKCTQDDLFDIYSEPVTEKGPMAFEVISTFKQLRAIVDATDVYMDSMDKTPMTMKVKSIGHTLNDIEYFVNKIRTLIGK